MIDIKELRRLAQAAMHPVTKGRWMRLFGERTVYDRMEDGCRGIPVVSTPVSPPHPFEAACLDFIAAANPAAVIEILDRLEAAESECLEQARLNGMGGEREAALMAKLEAAEKSDAESLTMYRKARDERDALRAALRHEADCVEAAKAEIEALRAKIEATEQQEPARLVTPTAYRWRYRGAVIWQYGELTEETARRAKEHNHEVQPLYALPGAHPAPSVPDDIVREVLRDCCGTFHGSRHRITCEKYKGKRD